MKQTNLTGQVEIHNHQKFSQFVISKFLKFHNLLFIASDFELPPRYPSMVAKEIFSSATYWLRRFISESKST